MLVTLGSFQTLAATRIRLRLALYGNSDTEDQSKAGSSHMVSPENLSSPENRRSRYQEMFADTDMRSIAAAITSITAVGAGLGLSGPLLSLLMERQGISSTVIGANTAVAGLAAMIAVPFVTELSRRIGVVNAILLNIVLSALCLAAFYFTDPIPSWFAIRFLMSCNLSLVFVLSEFWINHAANDRNRGLILGIYGTVLSLGFAIGASIVSLVGIDGFLPFGIGAAVIIAAVIPPFIARKEQPIMEASEKTPSIIPYIFMVPMATASGFAFGAIEQAELALLPVFATKAGYSEMTASFLLTVLLLGNVIFQIPLGIWSDRVKDRRLILVFCAVIGLGGAILLPVFAGNIHVLYAIVLLWGGVIGGLYTVGLAHLGSRLTGTDLAQANAAFVLCYAAGMTIGPQVVGGSMDLFGLPGFGGGLAFFLIAFLMLYAYRKITAH
ncbi:MAG: MFS transporter [Pseudomonadota bacterium]